MDSVEHILKLYNGSEWISLTGNQYNFLSGNNLGISGTDSVVDLSVFLDNTDTQILSLTGNSLTIEDGNSVDLSAFLDNTDEQKISLLDNTLRISGSSSQVDLSKYFDNTDEQTLSLTGHNLSIEDGNTVDLSVYADNTDEQTLSLNGTTLSISNGNNVELSSLLAGQQNQIEQLTTQIEGLNQAIEELQLMVSTLVGTKDVSAAVKSSTIEQNIPNPFSTSTDIPFTIDSGAKNVYLAFYTQQGQLVKKVEIIERGSGSYTFIPESNSKIYLYSLYVDGVQIGTKKMLVSK
jgi:hypothetical protein